MGQWGDPCHAGATWCYLKDLSKEPPGPLFQSRFTGCVTCASKFFKRNMHDTNGVVAKRSAWISRRFTYRSNFSSPWPLPFSPMAPAASRLVGTGPAKRKPKVNPQCTESTKQPGACCKAEDFWVSHQLYLIHWHLILFIGSIGSIGSISRSCAWPSSHHFRSAWQF